MLLILLIANIFKVLCSHKTVVSGTLEISSLAVAYISKILPAVADIM